jgi:hypothetical protein
MCAGESFSVALTALYSGRVVGGSGSGTTVRELANWLLGGHPLLKPGTDSKPMTVTLCICPAKISYPKGHENNLVTFDSG